MSSPYSPLSVAEYYRHLFPARTDVYSRWTDDGWRPLREPLTAEVVLDGLSGKGPSISGYMIAPPGATHSFAIDFDRDDGYELAVNLGKALWAYTIVAVVERSRRGAHLWATLDEVTPARVIRMGLWGMLQQVLEVDPHDPKIELRPGSDTVAEDGLGHCLRLPFMPHPKTGQHWRLLSPASEKPIGNTLAESLLWMADRIPGRSQSLYEWAERYVPAPDKPSQIPPTQHLPHKPYPKDDSTASEILRTLWGVERAAPGRSVKCPAHEDAMPSLSILRDDRRAICKAPHCILNNNDRGRGTYELRQLARHEQ